MDMIELVVREKGAQGKFGKLTILPDEQLAATVAAALRGAQAMEAAGGMDVSASCESGGYWEHEGDEVDVDVELVVTASDGIFARWGHHFTDRAMPEQFGVAAEPDVEDELEIG